MTEYSELAHASRQDQHALLAASPSSLPFWLALLLSAIAAAKQPQP